MEQVTTLIVLLRSKNMITVICENYNLNLDIHCIFLPKKAVKTKKSLTVLLTYNSDSSVANINGC